MQIESRKVKRTGKRSRGAWRPRLAGPTFKVAGEGVGEGIQRNLRFCWCGMATVVSIRLPKQLPTSLWGGATATASHPTRPTRTVTTPRTASRSDCRPPRRWDPAFRGVLSHPRYREAYVGWDTAKRGVSREVPNFLGGIEMGRERGTRRVAGAPNPVIAFGFGLGRVR